MHVEWVPNRNSRPTILLRETWREGKKVKKRTLANLTDWPHEKIEALRRVLKGETLISPDKTFTIEQSLPHGHVEAILGTIKNIGLNKIISSKPKRVADLVIAMIAERLIHPSSKLATTRLWHTTTLAEELSVSDADEDELYDALDWLLSNQNRIEKKLADKHLKDGCLVLYDVTSSYYEGNNCPLAQFGHDRDKKGKKIIVYGVLTDSEGCPVAVTVYPGNTGDPTTVTDQIEKLKKRFGLNHIVLVGDRGMITTTQIEKIKDVGGIGWITALRSSSIRELVEQRHIQMSLFDVSDFAEISSPDYPGERLVACYNPILADHRRKKRNELLEATEKKLNQIVNTVARRKRTPLSKAEIGKKVGAVINAYRMGKHFILNIEDGHFSYTRDQASIEQEEALDGIYVIRTSEQTISSSDIIRYYKNLSQVERIFRTLKGIDLLVRPIWLRTTNHVKAHIFLCMLAYYVEWHMRGALAPLIFHDEDIDRKTRHPVRPPKPSESAKGKKTKKLTPYGLPVHSFSTLLAHLGTRCRNICRVASDEKSPAFYLLTEPTPVQKMALQLLKL